MSNLRQYRSLRDGEVIVVGCDCSMGCGDQSVAQFYSMTNFDYPMVWSSFCIASEMTNELKPILDKISEITYYRPLVAYERNNGGVFEIQRLAAMNTLNKFEVFKMPEYGNTVSGQTDRLGVDTNTATRPEMLSTLKQSIDSRVDCIYDKKTIDELYSFIMVRTSSIVKAQAEKNAHDDHVMAMAIAKFVSRYADKNILGCGRRVIEVSSNYTSKWRRNGN